MPKGHETTHFLVVTIIAIKVAPKVSLVHAIVEVSWVSDNPRSLYLRRLFSRKKSNQMYQTG